MMNWFLLEYEGAYILTVWGYFAVAAIVACMVVAIYLLRPKKKEGRINKTKRLAFCAMAIALGFVTSYIKIIDMPLGGAATLCSMLFIVLIGYWYGLGTGLLTAFTYSMLQFLQGPYMINFWQVCFDYVFAFTALGLSGLFTNAKNGLIKGYLVAIFARGLLHSIGGYLFYMEWIPETFPQSLTSIYPLVYNYSYILAEGAITVAILLIPAVKKAMERVKTMAIRE
jgi:thiamine transporter